LEQSGVLDALTKVLVGLYEEPERPTQAVDYVRRYMGAPSNVDVEGLKRENAQLKAELEQLKRQMLMNNNTNSSSGGPTSMGGGGGNTPVNGPKNGKKGNGSSS
jgi:hypothetical protein